MFLFPITVVSQINLVITANGIDKIYDRQTEAEVSLKDNRDPGDVFDVYFTEANFDTWDVGTDKPILVTGIYLVGPDADKYTHNTTAVTSANIVPKPMWGIFSAADKVYDGNTNANITGRSLIGILTGDEDGVELIGGSANFNDPNVGSDKLVIQVGMSYMGYRGFNYYLDSVAPTKADITPLQIVGKFEVDDKIYDGNTSTMITRRYMEGIMDKDTMNISMIGGIAYFDNRNAGVEKFVAGDGFSIQGAGVENYIVTIIDTTYANIFPRPVDIIGVPDIRVYDRTINSNDTPIAIPELIAPDYGVYSQIYDDKNVGTEKLMTPTGQIYDGNLGKNYIIRWIPKPVGTILPVQLYGQITVADKVYDGNTDATITKRSRDGVLDGDNVSLVDGIATFNTPWVGKAIVTGVGLSIIGPDARNYLCSSVATTTADITPLISPSYVTSDKPAYYNLNDMVTLTAMITSGGPLMKDGPQAASYTVFSVDGYIVSDTTDNVNITLHIDPITNDLKATIRAPLRELAPNGIMEPGTKEVHAGFLDEDFNYIVSPNPAINEFDFAPNFGIILYPNPNDGKFIVEIEGNLKDDIRLSIMDITGKEIYEKEYQKPLHKRADKYNLTAHPDGIYILKLKSGSSILYRKILKTNLAPTL